MTDKKYGFYYNFVTGETNPQSQDPDFRWVEAGVGHYPNEPRRVKSYVIHPDDIGKLYGFLRVGGPGVLLKLEDGRKLAIFHGYWSWAVARLLGAPIRPPNGWEEADIIVCCYPQGLPKALREKHPFPNRGVEVLGTLNFNTSSLEVEPCE